MSWYAMTHPKHLPEYYPFTFSLPVFIFTQFYFCTVCNCGTIFGTNFHDTKVNYVAFPFFVFDACCSQLYENHSFIMRKQRQKLQKADVRFPVCMLQFFCYIPSPSSKKFDWQTDSLEYYSTNFGLKAMSQSHFHT